MSLITNRVRGWKEIEALAECCGCLFDLPRFAVGESRGARCGLCGNYVVYELLILAAIGVHTLLNSPIGKIPLVVPWETMSVALGQTLL